jgi:hypothetical protein
VDRDHQQVGGLGVGDAPELDDPAAARSSSTSSIVNTAGGLIQLSGL